MARNVTVFQHLVAVFVLCLCSAGVVVLSTAPSKPGKPEAVTLTMLSGTTALLTFDPPYGAQTTGVTGYNVEVAGDDGFSKGLVTINLAASASQATIDSDVLSFNKAYVRIRAFNSVGPGPFAVSRPPFQMFTSHGNNVSDGFSFTSPLFLGSLGGTLLAVCCLFAFCRWRSHSRPTRQGYSHPTEDDDIQEIALQETAPTRSGVDVHVPTQRLQNPAQIDIDLSYYNSEWFQGQWLSASFVKTYNTHIISHRRIDAAEVEALFERHRFAVIAAGEPSDGVIKVFCFDKVEDEDTRDEIIVLAECVVDTNEHTLELTLKIEPDQPHLSLPVQTSGTARYFKAFQTRVKEAVRSLLRPSDLQRKVF